jgi:hypothetical protein
MTGGGEIQPDGDEHKFPAEEEANQQAGAKGAIAQGEAFPPQEHQPGDEEGREERAQADLKDGVHFWGCRLNRDLLQAPADAERKHHRRRISIECFTQRRFAGGICH